MSHSFWTSFPSFLSFTSFLSCPFCAFVRDIRHHRGPLQFRKSCLHRCSLGRNPHRNRNGFGRGMSVQRVVGHKQIDRIVEADKEGRKLEGTDGNKCFVVTVRSCFDPFESSCKDSPFVFGYPSVNHTCSP